MDALLKSQGQSQDPWGGSQKGPSPNQAERHTGPADDLVLGVRPQDCENTNSWVSQAVTAITLAGQYPVR